MPLPRVPPNPHRFASKIAARLPGVWTSAPHHPDVNDLDRFSEVWDNQTLTWATSEFNTAEAAVLTRSNGDRLLAMAHPMRVTDIIVGALAPPGTGPEPFWDDNAPRAITVPNDPIRSATIIARRFLPRYEEALSRMRLSAAQQPGDDRATRRAQAARARSTSPSAPPATTGRREPRPSQPTLGTVRPPRMR